MLRETFCLRAISAKGKILLTIFLLKEENAKGHVLLRETFCLRTNFAKGKIVLKEKT